MPGLPEHPYLVCATQRSGSTLLCETLRATGVAGQPLEHFQDRLDTGRPPEPRDYFAGSDDPEPLSHLAPREPGTPPDEPVADWWARVLADGTGPNGVWGGKLMWDQVPDLTTRFRSLLGDPNAQLRDGIDSLLGDTRLIFVSRPSRVEQAVSLWKAVQTRRWRDGASGGSGAEPVYSRAGIAHLADWLERGDAGWRAWFAEQAVEPYVVDYDRLSAHPPVTARAVLDHIGIEVDEVPAPPLRRQADRTSYQWAERFRRETGVAA